MAKSQRKQKKPVEKPAQLFQPKDFLDLIAPAAVKFNTDSYVLGGLYRCVLALRGYPAATEELALLSHICNRAGVTLHLYARQVTAAEEDAIYRPPPPLRGARQWTENKPQILPANHIIRGVREYELNPEYGLPYCRL